MTHEFKTPISTIAISSEVLKNPGITNEPDRLLKYATVIQHESNRLKQQVDRVLQMARLDDQKIELNKEAIDGNSLVENALGICSLSINEKGGKINMELKAVEGNITVDKLHFTNVIYNLIDNAIKYNKQSPEICVRSYNEKSNYCLEIQDNGIGIKVENYKKIFERFYRVPTGNVHDVKGFGLGLNYVKLIIEAHKGTVAVESKMNEGTKFKITLPI